MQIKKQVRITYLVSLNAIEDGATTKESVMAQLKRHGFKSGWEWDAEVESVEDIEEKT